MESDDWSRVSAGARDSQGLRVTREVCPSLRRSARQAVLSFLSTYVYLKHNNNR